MLGNVKRQPDQDTVAQPILENRFVCPIGVQSIAERLDPAHESLLPSGRQGHAGQVHRRQSQRKLKRGSKPSLPTSPQSRG